MELAAVASFFCLLENMVFYFMCRAADSITLISKSDLILHTLGSGVMRNVIDTIVYVLPSLGRFTKTDWLAYGYSADALAAAATSPILFVVLQTSIYVALIGAATMVDFSRKNI